VIYVVFTFTFNTKLHFAAELRIDHHETRRIRQTPNQEKTETEEMKQGKNA